MANIGINLVEVDGRATPSIQGASTSVAGFLARTHRGVPGAVRTVTNFTEFVEYFGGYKSDAFGAYAIKGFFDNGGALAYVARIVKEDVATAATVAVASNPGLVVTAAYRGHADPGVWGNGLRVQTTVNPASNGDPSTWNLIVEYNGKVVETLDHLPHSPASAFKVNDEYSGSRYIKLDYPPGLAAVLASKDAGTPEIPPIIADPDADPPVEGVDGVPAVPPKPISVALAGGTEDGLNTEALVGGQAIVMLNAGTFDTYDVQLLACPECTQKAVLDAGTTYCAGRGDCIYIAAAPDGDYTATKAFGASVRAQNVYGAVYFPFISVNDPLGTTRYIPPIGHVMGVYARTDRERGVWKAPAGVNATVRGVLEVKYQISDTKHTLLVKEGGVNAVRYLAGQGVIVDSSRTLSSNPLWQYVNVRLLFNFVKSSLKNGLRWVVQEPNDEHLWNKVKHNSVVPFLNDLWRRGAFGPGERADVYSVKIDKENNPGPNIQQGILNVEVYFYPSRPAETFIITVGQQEGGPSASES